MFISVKKTSFLLLLTASRTLAYSVPDLLAERSKITFPPELPTEDPFYKVPENVSKFPAGHILGHRRTPNEIAGLDVPLASVAERHQFLYRTTDTFGNATATVLSVLIPKKADMSKVLSWQIAGDYAAPNCAPSYAIQAGSDPDYTLNNLLVEVEALLMKTALLRGWVVITPDYEGPNAAFEANVLAGHATLDGIRAALSSTKTTGIQPDANVGLFGYSGGSQASLSAAELQPVYAPELKISGVAVGGSEPDLESALEATGGKGVLLATALIGLSKEYPELKRLLDEQLSDTDRETLSVVTRQCLPPSGKALTGVSITDMLESGFFTRPDVKAVLHANSLGHGVPTAPVYFYHGKNDGIGPIKSSEALARKYCYGNPNSHVKFDVLLNRDHATAVFSSYRAFEWLADRLNGVPIAESDSCLDAGETAFAADDFVKTVSFIFGDIIGIGHEGAVQIIINFLERAIGVVSPELADHVMNAVNALEVHDGATALNEFVYNIYPHLGQFFKSIFG